MIYTNTIETEQREQPYDIAVVLRTQGVQDDEGATLATLTVCQFADLLQASSVPTHERVARSWNR